MNTRQRGTEWEQKVCRYLKDKGYFIVDVNFACACGEIDIIAAQRQTLVFIEVKSRHNRRYGEPVEAVNPAKQRHIRIGAKAYVMKRRIENRRIRFDVVEVIVSPAGETRFRHTRNAF